MGNRGHVHRNRRHRRRDSKRGTDNSGNVDMATQTGQIALVQGEESRWNIDGRLGLSGIAGGTSGVSVVDGALLSSREASLGGSSGGGEVRIGGGGSTWWSGDLSLQGEYADVSVTGGGLLYSDAVSFSSCFSGGSNWGSCAIRVDGPGSQWISNGPVSVAATETGLSTIDITDHALAVIRDNVTIGNNSQLNLKNGGLIAHETTIAGGELRGTGVIDEPSDQQWSYRNRRYLDGRHSAGSSSKAITSNQTPRL